jgi:uroporphyrinogen-III synthase
VSRVTPTGTGFPTKPLMGRRIAVAGDRRFDDIRLLVEKQGGEAVSRPMMRTAPLDDPETTRALLKLCDEGCDWLMLVTGMGTRAMVGAAEALGRKDNLLARMQGAKIAARGYKTVKALKELGLKPVVQDDDGTTEGLRRQLEPFDFGGARVAFKLYGERVPELTEWLENRGASVLEIPLYRYQPPSDAEVRTLLSEILSGDLDAVAFTSNTQVRYLFSVAERFGEADALRKAFAGPVQAASVGSMTSASLQETGVTRITQPEHERMGAMVVALAEHFRAQG